MNNIFKNAFFGKAYKTRDGRRAIYNYHSTGGYHDIIIDGEGLSYHFADHTNGILRLPLPSEIDPDVDYSCPIDIVSEWTEPIDEYELSRLACNFAGSMDIPYRYKEAVVEGFKAGYRKAMER